MEADYFNRSSVSYPPLPLPSSGGRGKVNPSITFSRSFGKRHVSGREVASHFFRRAKHARLRVVELAFPARDDHRCQTIAEYVDRSAAHVHQLVDAKDHRDADRAQATGHETVEWRQQNH